MLHLNKIIKSFGGTKVLQGVSFEVPVGKVTALIGPNGAGKTTLFDVISGFVSQDVGTVAIRTNGGAQNFVFLPEGGQMWHNITKLETYQRARLGISRTFQQVKLCENLTIEDHFQMVEDNEDERLFKNVFSSSLREGFRRSLPRSPRFLVEAGRPPRIDRVETGRVKAGNLGITRKNEIASDALAMTDNRDEYGEFLKSLDLEKPLETRVLDLSYGQRKLLDFGLAIYRTHSILLLDEPVAGVNQVIRKRIHRLLEDLKKKGETIFLIEHDIDFVRALADEVIVLDEGKVLTTGTPGKVLSDKKVLEAYLGE